MLICAISAAALAATYNATKPLIEEQREQQQEQALAVVSSPRADLFKKKNFGETEYYEAHTKNKIIGYILRVKTQGYASEIDMMIGLDRKAKITAISVIDQQETPGLGANITQIKPGEETPWFLRQFEGRSSKELNLKNIQAITGATITTEAVITAVKEAVENFKRNILDK